MKRWLRSLIAPSRSRETHAEDSVEEQAPPVPVSEEVVQAAGVELARMLLPAFVAALQQQAAQHVEEAREEQSLAALRHAAEMSRIEPLARRS